MLDGNENADFNPANISNVDKACWDLDKVKGVQPCTRCMETYCCTAASCSVLHDTAKCANVNPDVENAVIDDIDNVRALPCCLNVCRDFDLQECKNAGYQAIRNTQSKTDLAANTLTATCCETPYVRCKDWNEALVAGNGKIN